MTRRSPSDVGNDLKSWLQEHDWTHQRLADEVTLANAFARPLTQSWISRICNGEFARYTGRVKAVLDYANIWIEHDDRSSAKAEAVIRAAIEEAWDGSIEGAEAIARLLRSASALAGPPKKVRR